MESVEQTKHRLLRQAVQENVEGARGPRPQARGRRRGALSLWLWSGFLIATLVYVLAPGRVVSTGSTSSTADAKIKSAVPPLPLAEINLGAEPPLPQPRPLNRAVVPLSIKRIVIDAGHGGRDTGAVADTGLSEKDVTLDIALRLRRLVINDPFEVLLTREDDRTVSLAKRVESANSSRADLFVSIHVNWLEPRSIRALETFYVGPTEDPAVIKLASLENRDSGYSLADYRRILEKVYIDERRDDSRELARSIHAELYRELKQLNPKLENRRVKTAPFAVLIGTQMPAILVEVSCLSNNDEVALLSNGDYREKIALAILRGIRRYSNNFNIYVRKGS